jgi:hypothetical protein
MSWFCHAVIFLHRKIDRHVDFSTIDLTLHARERQIKEKPPQERHDAPGVVACGVYLVYLSQNTRKKPLINARNLASAAV